MSDNDSGSWIADAGEFLKLCREGKDSKFHRDEIHNLAGLFLAAHKYKVTGDALDLEAWTSEAVEDALKVSRERQGRTYRNYNRSVARAKARSCRRRAAMVAMSDAASLSAAGLDDASAGAVNSPAADFIWDEIINSSRK